MGEYGSLLVQEYKEMSNHFPEGSSSLGGDSDYAEKTQAKWVKKLIKGHEAGGMVDGDID